MILALEQARGAVAYEKFAAKSPVCLVVGNEVEGVSEALMACCDSAIEIKMLGIKNSLNVAVAFGVAAFALRKTIQV